MTIEERAKRGTGMELSPTLAEEVFWWANWVLVGALVVGVIATYAIVVSGNAKERHSKLGLIEKEEALEKYKIEAAGSVAEAHARAAGSMAVAADATLKANRAAKDAAEAQLALEKFKAPRQINGEEFVKALEGKPKAPVEIVFVRDDPECWQLAMQIRDWLKVANWEHSQPAAITGADEPRFSTYPSSMQAGGQPKGVTIVLRVTSQADFEREKDDFFNPDAPIDTPRKALSRALAESLGGIGGSMNFDTGKVGVLRVVVGPKP